MLTPLSTFSNPKHICLLLLRTLHALCHTYILSFRLSLSSRAETPVITSIEEEEQFFYRSILEVCVSFAFCDW